MLNFETPYDSVLFGRNNRLSEYYPLHLSTPEWFECPYGMCYVMQLQRSCIVLGHTLVMDGDPPRLIDDNFYRFVPKVQHDPAYLLHRVYWTTVSERKTMPRDMFLLEQFVKSLIAAYEYRAVILSVSDEQYIVIQTGD